ncbi:MAG: hypothetical protein IJS53_04760 [Clostridia bacterium]|nr:hypothetical protein [Clostridia bacterium]
MEDRIPAREHLRLALLRGDRQAVLSLARTEGLETLSGWKNALMEELTGGYLAHALPFCQLTAAAQAASALYHDAPPVVCCGGVAGNTSATGQNFMMMLLRAWGVPAIDLGCGVPAERFLAAVREHGLQYVICVAFSAADAGGVLRLHEEAARQGLRGQFLLLLSGAQLDENDPSRRCLDCPDTGAAAVANWVVRSWRG